MWLLRPRSMHRILAFEMWFAVQAELDVFTQFAGKNRKISAKERVQIRDSLIWFDWFSVPQMLGSC